MTAVDVRWWPLTAAQRAVWLGHQLDPTTAAYNTAEVVAFDGRLPTGVLERALRLVVEQTPALRLRFREGPSGPEQCVGVPPRLAVAEVDLRSEPDPEAAAWAWMRATTARRLDLHTEPLLRAAVLRVTDDRDWWFQLTHHLALDGFGFALLARRVMQVAGALAADAPVPALRPGWDDWAAVVGADQEYQTGLERAQDQDFWGSGLRPAGDPGADGTGVALGTGAADRTTAPAHRWSAELPETTLAAVQAAATATGCGWTDVLLAATGGWLLRTTGASRYRMALPLLNRAGANAAVVCTAMNLVPLEVTAAPGIGVVDLVAQVRDRLPVLRRHGRYRAEDLARDAARGGTSPLFGAQVNLVPFERGLRLGGLTGVVSNVSAGPVDPVTVCFRGTVGRGPVRLELDGAAGVLRAEDVSAHGRRLLAWLDAFTAALLAEAPVPLDDLPLLPDEERHRLGGFTATDRPRVPRTLDRAFAEQVRRSPGAAALVDADRRWTYAEMDGDVGDLATRLWACGVGRESVVGVALPRSAELVIALHAVHRAGGAHLPLDVDLPVARLTGMVQDARPAVLLVDATTRELMVEAVAAAGLDPAPVVLPVDLDLDLADTVPTATDPGAVGAGPEDAAYLLFTSGSTGRPKAAVITHAAIDNRLVWMQHHFGLQPGERAVLKTPASFDVSVWEFFWPLQVGATLVVAPPQAHRDPRELAELLTQQRVSIVHFVPSMLAAFLADPAAVARVAAGGALRSVVCSGEALPGELARRAAERLGVRVTNLYGPTEAAVDVTVHDLDPADQDLRVPIGRPIWNTRCVVLDDRQRPVPVGVAGTLWLGGVQLARGYVGRPELTAERFRTDLVDVDAVVAGGPGVDRWYDTGDLARWWPDGSLEYLGRRDGQVKIRGRRIELGEIEAVLADIPGVTGAAVTVVDGQRLAGWLTVADGASAEGVLTAARDRARRLLPDWMVPDHLGRVAALPVSSSGKLDRRALPAPPVAAASAAGATAPSGPVLQQVCAVVAEVLAEVGVALPADRVSPEDDFFTLGGTSLSALRLLGRLEEVFGVRPPLGTLFDDPTAAGLAAQLTGDPSEAGGLARDLDVLLPLRPTGDQPPLFCFAPAGGLAWCYAGLLPHLPSGVPVIGVQAPGLLTEEPTERGTSEGGLRPSGSEESTERGTTEGGLRPSGSEESTERGTREGGLRPSGSEESTERGTREGGLRPSVPAPEVGHQGPLTLADVAATSLARMRTVQPSGPYRLLGWSVGGMLAHEVAVQLQTAGETVELLGMLDAYPSVQWRSQPDPTEAEALRAVLRIAGAESRLDGTPPTRELTRRALTESGSALAVLPEEVLDAVLAVVLTNTRLVRRSEHGVFDGDLFFVTAAGTRSERRLDADGWRPHLTGTIRGHELPGAHQDLISPPALAVIGGWLRAALAAHAVD
ncbi:non-ribosomal peptide synthetase [Nakamurella leprariae]|uniref:Amino acid adenylation domain-containing protein n=1 Tax=Nakamurella leprariae TaxID=2803911 RepID=A0A938YE99_9ACTN|nr:non-ribosomal peptide synthetase [Nakamurella leprariae]MBM9466589.1 amino acid adenylation domain-containing protein [Nakamurella leprariae]